MSDIRDLARSLGLPPAATEGDAMISLAMATQPTPIRKGDRIKPSGVGRTAAWPSTLRGTVLRVSAGKVYVKWDDTSFEDEVSSEEVSRA